MGLERGFLRKIAGLCGACAVFWPRPVHAEDVWDDAKAARRLVDTVPNVAYLEGSWSLAEWVGSFATSRRWDSPYGWAPQLFTRVLYGTTWTVMQGVESGAAVALGDRDFSWSDQVRYRTQWYAGLFVPAGCAHVGAEGGCGLGTGSFSSLAFRVKDTHFWLRNDGGWIESRVSTNERRTLEESTFALVPAEVLYELSVNTSGAPGRARHGLGLTLRGGVNLLVGLHQAHVHPRYAFRDAYPKTITEMAFLDVGAGVGGALEARVDFAPAVSLFGQARFVPLPAGGVRKSVEPEAERLATDRPGDFVTYRQVVFGASHWFPSAGLDLGLGYSAMELSGRRAINVGHGAAMIQLEYTIDK